jgi:hypothetical protein
VLDMPRECQAGFAVMRSARVTRTRGAARRALDPRTLP